MQEPSAWQVARSAVLQFSFYELKLLVCGNCPGGSRHTQLFGILVWHLKSTLARERETKTLRARMENCMMIEDGDVNVVDS